jgi:uncharacterized membrane protein YfcA
MELFIVFLTGIAVGFISTLFGLGGGIIMVPVLSLILPFSHIEAVATSLTTIIFVAGFNTFNFHRKRVVVWPIVPWIALPASLMAFVTAQISLYLPENLLVLIFLLFLMWVAIRTFLVKDQPHEHKKETGKLIPLGIGGLSGTISGFTGIGGGGITTPLMIVGGLVNNVQAAPTSNAIMIFTALFGSISFAVSKSNIFHPYMLGYIHLDSALLLFMGSALISRLGVKLNQHLPLKWRSTILGLILVLICVRLILLLINSK